MGCGFELRMRIRFCPYKEISAKAIGPSFSVGK